MRPLLPAGKPDPPPPPPPPPPAAAARGRAADRPRPRARERANDPAPPITPFLRGGTRRPLFPPRGSAGKLRGMRMLIVNDVDGGAAS